MWRITAFDRDGREVARYELESGELNIGRDPDRQLVLQSPSVSRRHCHLRVDASGPVIYDDNSANGVIVNGLRITAPTPVNQTSRVEVAEFRLQLEPVGVVAQAPPPQQVPMQPQMPMAMPQQMGMQPQMPMQQMGMQPQMPMQPMSGIMPMMPAQGMSGVMPMAAMPVAMAMPGDQVRLIAEGGPYDGSVFDLPPLPDIAVGRAVDNNLVLDDPSLSRKHARLRRIGGGRLEVEDLNSANGTYVNGRKITRAQLGPGETLRFGELMFRLDGGGANVAPRPSVGAGGAAVAPGVKYGFIGLCGLTVLVYLGLAAKVMSAPSGPPAGAAEEAIAKHIKAAEPKVRTAAEELDRQEWTKAKELAAQALDLDPANQEAARIRYRATRGELDEKNYKQATGEIAKDNVDSLRVAMQLFTALSADSAYRPKLAEELSGKMIQASGDLCKRKDFKTCASTYCDAYRVMLDKSRFSPFLRSMQDAERKAKTTAKCEAK